MKACCITVVIILLGLFGFAQYTYFNNTYLDVPESSNGINSICCFGNDQYLAFGGSIEDGLDNIKCHLLNPEGEISEDINTPYPGYAVYQGGTYGFEYSQGGFVWAGTLSSSAIDATAIVVWFNPQTMQPEWSHLFEELNDSLTISIMHSARKMADNTFWSGGSLLHYVDEDVWYEEFSTYLCHLDEVAEDRALQIYSFQLDMLCRVYHQRNFFQHCITFFQSPRIHIGKAYMF